MASNYAFHFHLALNFRLCTFKMLQLLGDCVPRPPAGALPLESTPDFPQLHLLDPPLYGLV